MKDKNDNCRFLFFDMPFCNVISLDFICDTEMYQLIQINRYILDHFEQKLS